MSDSRLSPRSGILEVVTVSEVASLLGEEFCDVVWTKRKLFGVIKGVFADAKEFLGDDRAQWIKWGASILKSKKRGLSPVEIRVTIGNRLRHLKNQVENLRFQKELMKNGMVLEVKSGKETSMRAIILAIGCGIEMRKGVRESGKRRSVQCMKPSLLAVQNC
jgi:hypothetical protein